MERFDVRGGQWALVHRHDGLGAFTWADYALWYQRQYRMVLVVNIVVVLVCAILAAYLVFHKHDPQPVQKISEAEYRQVLQEVEQLRASKVSDQRKIADLLALRKNYEAQLKTQNANNAKLVKQLEALQVSVPTQPIILEAIRKEAATEKGLRQAVARSFGGEIAGRIEVRP